MTCGQTRDIVTGFLMVRRSSAHMRLNSFRPGLRRHREDPTPGCHSRPEVDTINFDSAQCCELCIWHAPGLLDNAVLKVRLIRQKTHFNRFHVFRIRIYTTKVSAITRSKGGFFRSLLNSFSALTVTASVVPTILAIKTW